MPETKTPSVDEELREVERELAERERPLVWGEVDAEQLEAKERRRAILPRLLQAARIKRLELRIHEREQEIERLDAARAGAYERLEKAKAAELKAKERREVAYGEWGFAHAAVLSSEDRLKRYRRELRKLKGE
jgi:hypothetical protein